MPARTLHTNSTRAREQALATLADLLSSRNRAVVLAWMTPRLDTPFSLTELSRAVDVPISSLQHECYKLERLGVLSSRRQGNSRRYHAVLDHPLARPLIALVIATLGLETVLHDAVAATGEITAAVIAGAADSATNLLTLVIVGQVPLEGLIQAQQRIALTLGRSPDDVEIAYVQNDDWSDDHDLLGTLADRPLQPVINSWPPA